MPKNTLSPSQATLPKSRRGLAGSLLRPRFPTAPLLSAALVACGVNSPAAAQQTDCSCSMPASMTVESVASTVTVEGEVSIGTPVELAEPVAVEGSVQVSNLAQGATLVGLFLDGRAEQRSQQLLAGRAAHSLPEGLIFFNRWWCYNSGGDRAQLRAGGATVSTLFFEVDGIGSGSIRKYHEFTTPFFVDNTAGDRTLYVEGPTAICQVHYTVVTR